MPTLSQVWSGASRACEVGERNRKGGGRVLISILTPATLFFPSSHTVFAITFIPASFCTPSFSFLFYFSMLSVSSYLIFFPHFPALTLLLSFCLSPCSWSHRHGNKQAAPARKFLEHRQLFQFGTAGSSQTL